MSERIFLSPPQMNGTEMEYVKEAFDTNWIAPFGPNLTGFEEEMSSYLGLNKSLALSSGTAAMHLALMYVGVKKGDVVFCSDFTFAGSCNPVFYIGAECVFIDSDYESFNMSPVALEAALKKYAKMGRLPKAVIIVDLYGNPANYDKLLPLCSEYGVTVIEDAAEALGSKYHSHKCGTFGKISILSFNGNKIITTSGGGMACSNDEQAIKKMHFWANQSKEPVNYYLHKELGYNYRMSNVCAGIGRGQLHSLDDKIVKRKEINEFYRREFSDLPVTMAPVIDGAEPNFWLSVLTVDKDCDVTPDEIIASLENDNIESRRAWNPMHRHPVFAECDYITQDGEDVGTDIFNRGVCMPSGSGMSEDDLRRVAAAFRAAFNK